MLLRVSDIETGMDDATLERIFEPFFSTRPPTEANSRRDALELVRERPVDLIVTDVVIGYAEQAISRSSRLEPMLSKPVVPDDSHAAVAALLRTGELSQTA